MPRIFRHYTPESILKLGFAEGIIFVVSVYLVFAARFTGDSEAAVGAGPVLPKALLFAVVMLIAMMALGLYSRHMRDKKGWMLLRIASAFVIGLLAMSLIFYLVPHFFLGRMVFAWSCIISLAGIVLARLGFSHLVDQNTMKRRILVLGSGSKAATIDQLLRRKSDRREFVIVGYVQLPGDKTKVARDQCILHDMTLLEIARQQRVDEIVVAIDDRRKSFPMHEIVDCRMSGIVVMDLLSFFESQSGKIVLDLLHPGWIAYSDGFHYGAFRFYSKRLFDIVASLILLFVSWPLMGVAALAILAESRGRGPILYRQVRVGENWKLFQVLKFRSMQVNAEEDGIPLWADKKDSRVTRVGAVLRKLRIDELPQIFNVLRGDMSFVGPRPERPVFVEELSNKIPYYAERHRVKPGITGWAQICYPYGATIKDASEKLQYDLYYVKNYSLFLDLMILLQTAQVILMGKGAR